MTEDADALQQTLVRMVRGLVDTPDEVTVLVQADEERVAFLIRVVPAETGQVIGKQGRTARAIRTIALVPAVALARQ